MAGVTSTGFIAKTVADLTTDFTAAMRRVFGAGVNVDSRSRVGQLIALLADGLADVWALAEGVSGAFDPDSATGVLLDNLCALTGTTRKPDSYSIVSLVLTGTSAATVIGKQVSAAGLMPFRVSGVALSALPGWTASTPYPINYLITVGGYVWTPIAAGVSGSVAPSGSGPFVDGTVTWVNCGPGTFGVIDSSGIATVIGPVPGYAGTLTTIDQPVSGWSGVYNPFDAALGINLETDAQLRLRRKQELQGAAINPLGAVKAAILRTASVTSCSIFENVTDVTVDSMAPHSFECLVEGGTDIAVANAIFSTKPGGIQTNGSISFSFDANPAVHFNRPTAVNIYATVALVKDPALYPVNGDVLVQQAIVAAGALRGLGLDVVASRISGDIFKAVAGVLDVTSVFIGTSASPTLPTTIPISIRQRAAWDTSRVVVTSTNGVP